MITGTIVLLALGEQRLELDACAEAFEDRVHAPVTVYGDRSYR